MKINPVCRTDINTLAFPDWIDRDDPRLQGESLVLIHKSSRRIMHFSEGKSDSCWTIGLGFEAIGAKQIEGDGKTPEGWYHLTDKPESQFNHALSIHYPNSNDAKRGLNDKLISQAEYLDITTGEATKERFEFTALGGLILIHGGGSSIDWTLGCIALEDSDLLELRSTLPEDLHSIVLIIP